MGHWVKEDVWRCRFWLIVFGVSILLGEVLAFIHTLTSNGRERRRVL
jgi:hypothetical protein